MNQQFSKMIYRKNASETSRYNNNDQHPDHIAKTEILEGLHYESEGLRQIGGWSFIDGFETGVRSDSIHADEIIESLPNEWASDPQKILEYQKRMQDFLLEEIGDKNLNRDNLIVEMVVHFNCRNEQGEPLPLDQCNLHMHTLKSQRTINNEVEFKRYKRDYYQDPDTGKMIKTEEAKRRGIEPTHRKGEVQMENGKPVLLNNPLSKKHEEIYGKKFCKLWKERSAQVMMEIDPKLDLTVGRKRNLEVEIDGERKSLQLTQISFNRAEERSHPERVAIIKDINRERKNFNEQTLEFLKLEPNQKELKDYYEAVEQYRNLKPTEPLDKIRPRPNEKWKMEYKEQGRERWLRTLREISAEYVEDAKQAIELVKERIEKERNEPEVELVKLWDRWGNSAVGVAKIITTEEQQITALYDLEHDQPVLLDTTGLDPSEWEYVMEQTTGYYIGKVADMLPQDRREYEPMLDSILSGGGGEPLQEPTIQPSRDRGMGLW